MSGDDALQLIMMGVAADHDGGKAGCWLREMTGLRCTMPY